MFAGLKGFLGTAFARMRYYAPLVLGVVFIVGYLLVEFAKPPQVNPVWEKTIVSIEILEAGGFRRHGTGFLVSTAEGTNLTESILVTARHLISSLTAEQRRSLAYRYRAKGGASSVIMDEDLVRSGGGHWVLHPDADVACRLLGTLKGQDTLCTATNRFLPSDHLQPHAKVFLTRIPPEEVGKLRPRFERGTITQLAEYVGVNAPIRAGYDGGPVVYVPDPHSKPLTHWKLSLVGLISETTTVRPARKPVAGSSAEKVYAIIPAGRIQEVVERFQDQRRSPEFSWRR